MEICQICPNGKLMVIGDEIINDCPCSNFLLSSDNQKEVLKKFQEFFYEPKLKDSEAEPADNLLSEREFEVLKGIARGSSYKEIADNLHISINTVITHRKNITDKLSIKTIAGLTVYAIINNYIHPDEVRK